MIGAEDAGGTLAAALRRHLPGKSWADVRRLCTTGKVRLDGETRAAIPRARLRAGQQVSPAHGGAAAGRRRPTGFASRFEDGHVVVIDKPSGISSVPYDRKETGTAMDLVRAAWRAAGQARDRDAALHRAPHRQGHLGPALLRQDAAGRTRAAPGLPAPHRRPRLPGRRGGRRRRDAHRIPPRRRPGRRHPRHRGPRHARTQGNTPSRTSSRCVSFAARPCAGSASRPDAHIRSASTSPNAATRWSAKPSTSATRFAQGRKPICRAAADVARGAARFPPPGHGRADRIARRAARRLRDRARIAGRPAWRLPVTLTGPIRSALGAIVEAIRSGYGRRRASGCPELADAATTRRSWSAPRRCWSSSGRATSGSACSASRTSPTTAPALLVGNHSGGIPYDGAMLLYGLYRNHPAHRRVRPLVANFAFRSGWMANVVARVGGVRASTETALPLLAAGELVAVFPEGSQGRRQVVSRALSAGALRPRRVRPAGACRRRSRCCRSPSSAPRRSTP